MAKKANEDSTNVESIRDKEKRKNFPTQRTGRMCTAVDERALSSRGFVLRIALFNTLMFFLVIYTDCQVFKLNAGDWIKPPPRFGSWAVVLCVIVFLGNIGLLTRSRREWFPLLFTVLCGFSVSTIAFAWPHQHVHQMIGFGLSPVPGLLAAVIRSAPQESEVIRDLDIPFDVRLEWIKQRVAFWTTLALFWRSSCFWLSSISG